MLHILALFSFFLVSSSHAALQDFCVADFTAHKALQATPAGRLQNLEWPWRLRGTSRRSPGGVLPLHTHPGATEIILVARGAVTAGLISSDNTVYVKTVEEGDIMVFPQGLLHFLVNTGGTEALIWVSFSSPSPGLQVLNTALFGNNLDSDLLEKITLLGDDEVQRLKGIFGGTG
ncbi:Auxin-binding protein ABP19a [Vitis vinifera]|uniref:Germin-like protein n=1 Tax=Vitis vinifera TaxID=29760 RepID=A0A438FCL4_VITVI|nr:Auxin-binding protein ABP19a [Vitis vinifera]